MTEPLLIACVAGIAAVLGAVIGAGASLVGVWITQRNQTKTRESEERRWYLDYLLPKKMDALNNLYAAIMELQEAIALHILADSTNRPTPAIVKENVLPYYTRFQKAHSLALLHLRSDGRTAILPYVQHLTSLLHQLSPVGISEAPTIDLVQVERENNRITANVLQYLETKFRPPMMERVETQIEKR